MDENISGSGSGSFVDDDTHIEDHVISKAKPVINKSPVLYLRRRRSNDFARKGSSGRGLLDSQFRPGYNEDDRRFPAVDGGEIYPNHSSVGRVGQKEWVKFRDYKRQMPKWIKSLELRIDGA